MSRGLQPDTVIADTTGRLSYDIFVDQRCPLDCEQKPVGRASFTNGLRTWVIKLFLLQNEQFYLLPERNADSLDRLSICTRENSKLPGKRYFWTRVGLAQKLRRDNQNVILLQFDLFPSLRVYIHLENASLGSKWFIK